MVKIHSSLVVWKILDGQMNVFIKYERAEVYHIHAFVHFFRSIYDFD